ncbi:MAG: nitrogenase iron-molybdenum cofactor biosynthesis protein NifN, partial [Rhodomicrobium sp.]
MAKVEISKKACTVNPLKMSQPIGGALAFMGVNGCMPLLHGSQGCTSLGLVLFVRHFREAIPMQTTAMSEVATVLGGYENVEQAVITIANRAKPAMIGICSTGVTEIKGDDVDGFITLIRQNRPELNHLPLVYCSTPDFKGAFQDGWAATVTRMVEVLVETPAANATREANRINILPGCHLTPGDLEELRDIVEAFGLAPSFLPDLSSSLDGHIPETFTPTTIGGISVEEIARLGRAAWTIAIGEQMRPAAVALEKKTGAPFKLFDRLTGLAPNDAFIAFLAKISGKPVPNKYRRQRSQLLDAMLDGHFSFGGKKIAVGAEPDLLFGVSSWL